MRTIRKKFTISDFASGLLDIFLVVVVYVTSQLLSVLVLSILGVELSPGDSLSPEQVLGTYIIAGLVAGLFTVALLKRFNISKKMLGIRKPELGSIARLGGYFIVYLAATMLVSLIMTAIVGVDLSEKQDLGLGEVNNKLLLPTFISLVVITPAAEELLFRGFLYRRFRQKFAFLPSAIAVSAIFAILHGQFNVAIDTFILSMVIAWMLEKSNNLWLAYAMHSLKNLLAFLVVFVFKWA